tara:strand:+ start:928 stop:1335 length:408 start_codon:yes stop_codon:yes gene_type:complete
MAISDQEEAFCQAYILTRNGTDAARKAGYAQKTANSQSYRMLQKDKIKLRIEDLSKELRTDIDVVDEIEAQYKAAKSQGQGQVSLKALELLSRVRGNASDLEDADPLILEKNIIRCLEILGAERVEEILEMCDFD